MSIDSEQRFDVAISGAGLAGSALAIGLARAGATVALVDAATFPRDKLCGEFLSPESWDVLDRLGIADAIVTAGYQPVRRVRLTTPKGRSVEAEFAPDGRPPGIGISRSTLDHLLLTKAREAGVIVFEGARVGAILTEDGRVIGFRGRHPELGRVAFRAPVTIAADGRHSRLVDETGSVRGRSLRRPRLFGLKKHLDHADADAAGTVGLHLVAGGYVGTCRVEGGRANLCGLLPEALARRARGDLDRLAKESLSRNPALSVLLDAPRVGSPWKTVARVRVQVATPRLPGILYAGDCQGTVDPLGGQGMTMALLGAELVAPFVQRAITEGTVGSSLQADYRSAWEARFVRRITICRIFHHALTHPGFIDLASRSPGLASKALARGFDLTRDRSG